MQAKPGGCYRVYDAITAAGRQRNFDRVSTAKKKWAPSSCAATSRIAPLGSARCGLKPPGIFERLSAARSPSLPPALLCR